MTGKKKKGMSLQDKIFHGIMYVLFSLLAFLCFYPFYYILICSVSDQAAVELGEIFFVPKGFQLNNFRQVLELNGLWQTTAVTLLRTFIGTLSHVIVTAYAAYFYSRQEMPCRKLLYRLTVATMYFSAGMIPAYLNNRMLGLVNTFWIYIIPSLLGVYNMVLVKASMESLPPDLEESAYIDGAGYLTRLFRIVLPLQMPILTTIGLFSAVGHWNDYFTTKLYIVNTKLYTLQFRLYEMLQQVSALAQQTLSKDQEKAMLDMVTPMSMRIALTVVVTIPILCVYPYIQRYYVKGVMIGAVKG